MTAPSTLVADKVISADARHTSAGHSIRRSPQGRIQYSTYFRKKEKRRSKDRRFVLALPILPGRCQPSIVSRDELNYRVRNGNGWTLILISTNYCYPAFAGTTNIIYLSSRLVNIFSRLPSFRTGDPYRIRTDVNGVRGRCLNHLTNGPLVRLHGLEPGTH